MSFLSPEKYGLALHTTTPQLGLAITNFAQDNRQQVWDLGRSLSSVLHQYLQEIIRPQTWQDLEFIAVAKGPGGFTGTRIGVVTARTLAQQLNIPLYGISNLAAIAYSAVTNNNTPQLLAVEMVARREKLFVGIYQLSTDGIWQCYLPDTVMTNEAWQETLNNLQSPYKLIQAPEQIAYTVRDVLKLGYLQWQQKKEGNWSEVIPFYGQHPV
ncbi:MAG: tRNA (adenosine(37)-N6)-threonylcarbamoyltransferase complex dimerization subunit type 1 TsaB [Xenococcaceae cyanobacterium MO_207.B15]|nr:tRNA (adenosine(37)-N6)-threonylcarbamoyltransferase complex dimerization subunit type 1 TsaB [Xenococcaceae cyanobacterium MO_207.B15]